MSCRSGDAALAMTLSPLAGGRARRGHVDAGQGAVVGDVREDDPQHPLISHAPATIRASSSTFPASRASPPCHPPVDPTTIRSAPNRAMAAPPPPAAALRPSPTQPRRAQRKGPRHVVHRADAAAELDREAHRGPNLGETL